MQNIYSIKGAKYLNHFWYNNFTITYTFSRYKTRKKRVSFRNVFHKKARFPQASTRIEFISLNLLHVYKFNLINHAINLNNPELKEMGNVPTSLSSTYCLSDII